MGKTRTFEEELKQLEAEVSLMEEGNLPLDELIAHFRQGTEAAKNCYHLLQKAENDITILTEEVSRLADTGKEEKQNECTECIEGKTETQCCTWTFVRFFYYNPVNMIFPGGPV